jgi:hypothetical protein
LMPQNPSFRIHADPIIPFQYTFSGGARRSEELGGAKGSQG